MLRNKKTKTSFFIIYIGLLVLTFTVLTTFKNNNIKTYLKNESEIYYLNYKVIYNDYKNIANLIFNTHIQDEKILELFANRKRDELKNHLEDNYKKLRVFNLRQLHFHLPNNDSFLRMHRPNKFGDNLTKDRKTVAYVNKTKKYIDGFEEGKIFNGFRFVYPLFYENKHIGSVEISFSALFFIQEIAKSYNVTANFLIKKDVVDEKVFKNEQNNYMQSPLEDYYYQKSIFQELKLDKYSRPIEKNLKKEILTHMSHLDTFGVFVEEFQEVAIFIPLENPITKKVVAYLKVNKADTKINDIKNNFFYYFILSALLITVIFFYLYSQLNYQYRLEKQVEEKTKSLNELNKNLEITIQKEVAENRKKDELMIAQSRHAAMGEMISMIAHQWRQPLTTISMDVNNILADIELEMLNEANVKEVSENILDQTQYLSKTIDDFRNFFKPEKSSEKIEIKNIIEDTIKITNNLLENSSIKVDVSCNVKTPIVTFSRELLQVLINILKNAKEALENNPTNDRRINISCNENENFIEISIFNNGDEIDESIIDKIFEPYFSTKDEKTGTGLGLYMSKSIVEKHLKGLLKVINKDNGVEFIISLPFQIED